MKILASRDDFIHRADNPCRCSNVFCQLLGWKELSIARYLFDSNAKVFSRWKLIYHDFYRPRSIIPFIGFETYSPLVLHVTTHFIAWNYLKFANIRGCRFISERIGCNSSRLKRESTLISAPNSYRLLYSK